MNYNEQQQSRNAGVVRHICAFFFALWAFIYLYCLEGELLSAVQYAYSHGVTHYNHFVGAAIITIILLIVQRVVSRIFQLPLRFHALSYFPSALLLTMLTDFNQPVISHFRFGKWAWLAPLLLLLFLLLVWTAKQVEGLLSTDSRKHLSDLLWPNALLLLIFVIISGGTHSVKDTYLYELKTERLLCEGQFSRAAEVAKKSHATSPWLTELRSFALLKQDQLGERLFDFPQPGGADALLSIADTDTTIHRFTSRDIFSHFGIKPDHSVRSAARYLALLTEREEDIYDSLLRENAAPALINMAQTRLRHAYDYQLCRALLNRDLNAFTQLLPNYQRVAPADTLPRSYREAICQLDTARADTATLSHFRRYQAMCDTLPDPLVRSNLTRRKYGTTLWWYYDNPQVH